MGRLKHIFLKQKSTLISCLFVIISFLLLSLAISADFKSGYCAYKNGDYETALKEWRPLAEQGHAIAQYNLGLMYDKGEGVPEDNRESVKWYRLAAVQGYAHAQYLLGVRYYSGGEGVPQNYNEAANWFRLAAEQGDKAAQIFLGKKYYYGRGFPQDYKEAAKWYRMAAEQGDSDAQSALGEMYSFGRGVAQDNKESVKWYRLAAEQGDFGAQFNLGLDYFYGRGVPQDYVQAHMWLNLASVSTSNDTSPNYRDKVAEMMTPQQLAEAQRLAGQWKKKSAPASSLTGLPDNEPETSPRIVSSATGFVCGVDLIATNYHVIRDSSTSEIIFPTSGRTYQLQFVTADKTNDLAVLKLINSGLGVTEKQKPLQILAFSQAKIGEDLFTIGFPVDDLLGTSHKIAAGVLSSSSGIDNDPRMFQITAPIQPGNSGGPIFNSKGQVIGILISTLSAEYLFQTQRHIPQNVNFAIKSDYLLALIPQRSLDQKVQTGNLFGLSRADQVEVLRDSIGQVKTVGGRVK